MRVRLSWAVLALLLTACLVGAATLDRRQWPGLVGDEAVYLMQAQSLAWDFDLTYSRGDYERFERLWGRPPDGLILQSGDGGATLTYGKPAFYALFLAPFVRLAPVRGPEVANALLLALAAVAAAYTLSRRLGPAAPLWVAAWVFASVTFGYVFWVHADLFLMCLVALAFALAYGGRPRAPQEPAEVYRGDEEPRRRALVRWAAVGVLLATVALARPFYAPLLLPAALAVPRRQRRRGLAALGAGAAVTALAAVTMSLALHGSWTSYGGERMGFYRYTGFPEVDLGRSWSEELAERGGPGSWVDRDRLLPYDLEPRLTAYNAVYFLVGRHVGVLPYFLPALLGFAAWRRGGGRWALVLAVGLSVACFFYVRPFNFWGGGAALANRYFLPLYPALWFVAARRARAVWALVVALVAAPFLYPLWGAPRSAPFTAEGGYRWVSPVAQRLLPYETSQSHLKPAGREDLRLAPERALWIKLLSPSLRAVAGETRLVLAPGATGELLVGSGRPLAALELEADAPAPARLTVDGAEVTSTLLRPDGGAAFRLELRRPTARHRMWWTEDDVYLYRLRLLPAGDGDGRRLSFHLREATGG